MPQTPYHQDTMRHHFQSEQWLPYPVPHVFAFFSDPVNLPRLMPAWQHARIVQSTLIRPLDPAAPPNSAGAGTRLTLSFRPVPFSPVRVSWNAEIDQFVLNAHFCDTQLRGPFAFWHHCHRVAPETRNGTPGTLLTDDLHYEMPLGPLGAFANWLAVSGQIRSTFAFRHARTKELLAQPSCSPTATKRFFNAAECWAVAARNRTHTRRSRPNGPSTGPLQ